MAVIGVGERGTRDVYPYLPLAINAMRTILGDFIRCNIRLSFYTYKKHCEFCDGLTQLTAGPALGMFEVFGRTGPQNLGGGAILDPTKINLPV